MRPVLLLTLLASALTAPTGAAAQVVPSPFRYIETNNSLSIQGGYIHASAGSRDLGPRPGPLAIGRYERHLTGPLLGEVGLGYFPSTRDVYVRPGPAGSPVVHLGETDLDIVMAEAGLRLRLTGDRTWRDLAPYVAGSGGVAVNVASPGDVEEPIATDQRFRFGPAFAAGLALGSDYFVSERFSIRAEVRDHFWRLTYPAALAGTSERQNQWRHNPAFTLGGAFHF